MMGETAVVPCGVTLRSANSLPGKCLASHITTRETGVIQLVVEAAQTGRSHS